MNEIQTPFARIAPSRRRQSASRASFKPVSRALTICGAFWIACNMARADQFGDFTYLDTGTSITITDYPDTAVGAVVVPETIAGKPVTVIGTDAFSFCSGITSVTLPSGLTTIASRAFFNCTALTSAPIPETVTSIGDSAFYSCIQLTSIVIPSGVTVIQPSSFDSCRSATSLSIPEGVTSIGNNAFYNCTSLPSVTIPSSVTSIGSFAFSYCTALTSIEIPAGVTAISPSTFADSTSLTSVVLPAGVTSIGNSAFGNCTSLTTLVLPSTVNSIGSFAFTKCSSLTAITIPSGVTTIRTSTFESCSALTSMTLPASVTSIGDFAFRYCTSLTSFEINSASTTTIGNEVFESCTSLTSIQVSSSNPNFTSINGVLFTKSQLTLHTYPRGRTGPYVIPSTVTNIRVNAFRFSVGVTSIEIPASVTSIGTEAFSGCSALTSFSVHPSNPNFKSEGGILFTKSGKSLFAFPSGLGGDFSIPSGVTHITVSAFRYCGTLTSVTFPSTITNLGADAFRNCPQLAMATFTGNAPTSVGLGVFQSAAPEFTVFFNLGALDFTTPFWQTYPSKVIGIEDPYQLWLLANSLPLEAGLNEDSNGDGVSLLMAYALNLDPDQNLAGSLPEAVISGNQMSMSFYAGSPGVTYVVQTCTDFTNWTSEGVTLSPPDSNQIRTATVAKTGGSQFMRLSVAY